MGLKSGMGALVIKPNGDPEQFNESLRPLPVLFP